MTNLKMSWVEEGGHLMCRWSEAKEHWKYIPSWKKSDTTRQFWPPPGSSRFGPVFGLSLCAIQWCVPFVRHAPRSN